jgi:hypothetical protein
MEKPKQYIAAVGLARQRPDVKMHRRVVIK